MANTTRSERGAVLLITFVIMLVLSGIALAAGVFSQNSLLSGQSQLLDKQAFYVAEAGLHRTLQALAAGTWTSTGDPYTESVYAEDGTTIVGQYVVTITDNGDCAPGSTSCEYDITSEGYVPNQASYAARRQVNAYTVEANISSVTNHAGSAAATAWTSSSGHDPDEAIDGSNGSYWEAGTAGSGQWLYLDFGASWSTTLTQLVIEERRHITGITFDTSSNGTSWSSLSVTGDGDNSDDTWTFTVSTSARYVRATFTASGSSRQVSVREFEAYSATGGTPTFTNDGEFTTAR